MNTRWFALLGSACVVAGLLAGCSADPGPSTDANSPAPPSEGQPSVTVKKDVRFAEQPPTLAEWSEPLLDLYSPAVNPGNLPLVVLLPPHGVPKEDSPALSQLAEALAARGSVVAVANWSQLDDPPETFTDAEVLEQLASAGQSMADCAVTYAVAHASEHGADPTRLVVVGELYGANTASMVTFGDPAPHPTCAASASWRAAGLVAVNGDWFVGYPEFDALGDEVSRALLALTPWGVLADDSGSSSSADQRPGPRVRLVVTDTARVVSRRCEGDRNAEWLQLRNAGGILDDALDVAAWDGIFDAECLDFEDMAKALLVPIRQGWRQADAELVRLTNADDLTESGAGAHLEELGPSDLTLLVDTILQTAGEPAAQGMPS